MSYITEYSPCGHHVSNLKLIARTKKERSDQKSLRFWKCMEVSGMPFEITEEDLKKMVKDGFVEFVGDC